MNENEWDRGIRKKRVCLYHVKARERDRIVIKAYATMASANSEAVLPSEALVDLHHAVLQYDPS
jgi:hypothetical protein